MVDGVVDWVVEGAVIGGKVVYWGVDDIVVE